MTPFERLMFKEVFKADGYDSGEEEADMGDYVRQKFMEMADSVQREQEQVRRLFQVKRHALPPQPPSPRALPRKSQPVSSLAQRMQDLHTQRLLREREEEEATRAAAVEEEEEEEYRGGNWWESKPSQTTSRPMRTSNSDGNWWEKPSAPQRPRDTGRHLFHSDLGPRYLADTASSRLRKIHREQDAKSRVDFPLAHQAVFPAPLSYASRMGL